MREEARNWLAQARAELASARAAIGFGSHYLAAFCAHQAVEKALKAGWLDRKREVPPHTHNLLDLAVPFSPPGEIAGMLRRLNPHYSVSRNPDAANGVPALLYDESIARPLVDAAEKVMKWLDSA